MAIDFRECILSSFWSTKTQRPGRFWNDNLKTFHSSFSHCIHGNRIDGINVTFCCILWSKVFLQANLPLSSAKPTWHGICQVSHKIKPPPYPCTLDVFCIFAYTCTIKCVLTVYLPIYTVYLLNFKPLNMYRIFRHTFIYIPPRIPVYQ